MLRIMFGPSTYSGEVAYDYGIRITFVSFLYKLVIKTCFIFNIDQMALMSENKILMLMGACTTILSWTHVAQEALLRNHLGLDQFGRWCLNIYFLQGCIDNGLFIYRVIQIWPLLDPPPLWVCNQMLDSQSLRIDALF